MGCVLFRYATALLLAGITFGCDDGPREEVLACDRTSNSNTTLQLCTDALRLDDLTAEERIAVLFSRGSIHVIRNDLGAAKSDFLAIREVDPKSSYAPRGLAYLERQARNYEGALELYEEAIRLAPDDATLIGLRGTAKFGLAAYEEASKDFDFALDPPSSMHVDDVNVPSFRQMRGMSLVEVGSYRAALEDLDYWLERNPGEPWGLLYRGIARVQRGNVRDAMSDFDRAMTNGGSLSWLRDRLSRDNDFFFGPEDASYEGGVRYALKTLHRLSEDYPNLSKQALVQRQQELFPNRLFSNGKFLFQLESGLAPLGLKESENVDRVASTYYYGILINTLNRFGDPTCQAVVKSLDQLAADIAATKDVLSVLSNSESGGEFLIGLAVMTIGAALIEEAAADDAAMLAARHGCASDVVVNVLENGSTYLVWSMSLKG